MKTIIVVLICLVQFTFADFFEIVIDPGHGGSDIGAPGVNGNDPPNEADFNLEIGEKVYNELSFTFPPFPHYYYTYITRIANTTLTSTARIRIINGLDPDPYNYTVFDPPADFFLSIHNNSSTDPNVWGTSVHIKDSQNWNHDPDPTTQRFKLAHQLASNWVSATNSTWFSAKFAYNSPHGVVGRNDIWQVTQTPSETITNVVECEFVSYSYVFYNILPNQIYQNDGAEGIETGFNYYIEFLWQPTYIKEQNEYLQHFRLSNNYPNPFNPITTIEFDLPTKQFVSFYIFNSLGQCIRTLANGERNAGKHIVKWDGTNGDGRSVGSGIYIYKLKTPNFMDTKKMILLR